MRLLIVPLLVVTTSLTLSWTFSEQLSFPEEFSEVVAWLRGHGDTAWLVGIGVIMADAVLPVPSTPAMFAMGIIYGPLVGGLICAIAAVLAGLAGFGATRLLGRRGALFLVGEADLERAERFFQRWGTPAIVLGRAIGGPAEWTIILAGLSTMSWPRAFGALCLGGGVSGIVVASLGAMAVNRPLLATLLTVGLVVAMMAIAHALTRTKATPDKEE